MKCIAIFFCVSGILAYWDLGTTTTYAGEWRIDEHTKRTSRFRWQRSEHKNFKLFRPWWNWYELEFRRRLYVIAGLSYEMINLGTAAILNRRCVITAANLMDPYFLDQRGVRIWALGKMGNFNMPWRYRAWKLTRVNPRSNVPEHCHGPYCYHTPRHDVCVIHTLDQMYLYPEISPTRAYGTKTYLTRANQDLKSINKLYFVGSGFEYHVHIKENYKIFYAEAALSQIIDCSQILPKWWGKFICMVNNFGFPGLQNGGPLLNHYTLVGLGCFMHTYNDVHYMIFTDLRYYVAVIHEAAAIKPGEYYEYAYPEWGTFVTDYDPESPESYSEEMYVNIPLRQIREDLYPLGKKK